jgi:hypothetical protein
MNRSRTACLLPRSELPKVPGSKINAEINSTAPPTSEEMNLSNRLCGLVIFGRNHRRIANDLEVSFAIGTPSVPIENHVHSGTDDQMDFPLRIEQLRIVRSSHSHSF